MKCLVANIYKITKNTFSYVIKRKRLKCIGIFVLVLIVLYFFILILIGDLYVPSASKLTELERCPACYGVSICPELYSGKIFFDENTIISKFINAKNVYFGSTDAFKKVVLKKLAHNWELESFDKLMCNEFNRNVGCNPKEIIRDKNFDIVDMIHKTISFEVQLEQYEVRKGLVLCPYTHGLQEILATLEKKNNIVDKNVFLMNIWTTLNINPEPILLQLLPASEGWPVPAYAGACGRLIIESYNGVSLSQMLHVDYADKLNYAHQLLKAALDFTYKHERFRFYFMDWSLDNFVVDEKNRLTMIDLEDVIILDKQTSPQSDLPDWYKRYSRENFIQGFSFSINNICKHHLSDHNLWAVCYILAAEDMPLLYPISDKIKKKEDLNTLLNNCLFGDDKFSTVNKLLELISDIIIDINLIS